MHLLIIRFSAIGDVALTVPVIMALQKEHPGIKISILSRPQFRSLFEPLGVHFIGADLKGRHKDLLGLRKLYKEIVRSSRPDKVIDLHGVLRSHLLTSFFRLVGIPVFKIDKGRKGKRQLTRRKDKIRKPLPHTTLRYAEVFKKAGFAFSYDPQKPPMPDYPAEEAKKVWDELNLKVPALGIAPLATYPGKTWPMGKVKEVIEILQKQNIPILLFGGPADHDTLDALSGENIFNMAGRLGFAGEVALMRYLALMVSMDSSNMHLAALAGIPVVSVWGATHHFAGFGPLGKNDHLMAQVPVEQLPCRPCSVFGNKPCFRHDYACMHWLKPEDVMEKVILALKETEDPHSI